MYFCRFPAPLQGQRLRASGRLQEADEVDNMAAAIESRAEDHWRKTVEVNGEVQAPFVHMTLSIGASTVSYCIDLGVGVR